MEVMVTQEHCGQVRHLVVRAPEGAVVQDLLDRVEPDRRPGPGTAPRDSRPLVHGGATARSGLDVGGAPWLAVVAGPDAGAVAPLLPGRTVTVGRDPSCDLVLADPGLSRRHAGVRQDRHGVVVRDLASTNGVRFEGDDPDGPAAGSHSGSGWRSWAPGARLLLGASVLVLLARLPPPALTVRSSGHLLVSPWPRHCEPPPDVEVRTPEQPRPRTVRPPSPWSWSLPLVVAAVLALALKMPWLLLFALLGPTMVLGQQLGDRRAARSEFAEQSRQHTAAAGQAREHAYRLLRSDLTRRRTVDDGVQGVLTALLPSPSTRLWDRAGTVPCVVLGEGRMPSQVHLDATRLVHPLAPVTLSLDRPVALVGPARVRDALARNLLLQLVTAHPPQDLAVAVHPGRRPGSEWDLLAWLPHTADADLTPPGAAARTWRWGQDLLLADQGSDIPPGIPRVLLDGPHRAVLRRPGADDVVFVPTLVSLAATRDLARRLAPLRSRDAGGGAAAPAAARLGDLTSWPLTPEGAITGWSVGDLGVPVGVDDTGAPFVLDLARDGPHALVAGTTGSGKSELLRTLVTGLAVRLSPRDLALLLIDYKGGSCLGDLAGLPHVSGLVTDLDPHLAERVLQSLQAELGAREARLAEGGWRDLRDAPPGTLPRLVVVVDEFRVLAQDVPEVMAGLIHLASVGRSLGVHLVLATQRPAGVVGADLRANVNLRIALRVRDTADSHDVLDTADAARLPQGRPGMALVRTGADPPRQIQVATAGASRPAGRPVTWRVTEVSGPWIGRGLLAGAAAGPPGSQGTPGPEDDTRRLVPVLQAAATRSGVGAPRVWLPPLPGTLPPDPSFPDAWAIADLPEQQRRAAVRWRAATHCGIVGAARTGRSTALRALVATAGPAWVVVLDLGRGLQESPLRDHPGLLAWVGPDEPAHGTRVLEAVLTAVATRLADPATVPARLVIVLDGWDRFLDGYAEVERGRPVDLAHRLLREGPAAGVVAVVSGDRSLLLGKVAAALPQTWALHLNDPGDLLMGGLRRSQVPREQTPGRVVDVRTGTVAQVVQGTDADRPGIAPPGPPPLVVRSLPRTWRPPSPGWWACGGDSAVGLRIPEGSMVVLGPSGSGRTTALRALLGPGSGSVGVRGLDPPSEVEVRHLLHAHRGTVVVDDAHLLAGSPVEEVVLDWAHRTRGRLLVASDSGRAQHLFRGLVPAAARDRTGLVLHPTSTLDGAPVGADVPVGDLRVPGRGVLVHRGRCTRVQVAAA